MTAPQDRLTVVILTYNRPAELRRTVAKLTALPEQPPLIVVDNGSRDPTVLDELEQRYAGLQVIRLPRNSGAAARNSGAARAATPYVAFSDDDTWWAPGALTRAADLLDAWPRIAVLSARILVGPDEFEDPTCAVMAASPLPSDGLPGPALLGFMAGASVFRREAFLNAGGYEPKFFLGGEEELLAFDLAAQGWALVYAADLTVFHYPSPRRDSGARRRLLSRNALWVAWMRRPFASACRETRRLLGAARADGALLAVGAAALRGLPWALRRRRALPAQVEALRRRLE